MRVLSKSTDVTPAWGIIIWMLVLHYVAFRYGYETFNWTNFGVAFGLYFVTACFGITLGFHRLLTHRTFRVPKWLERFFATCGVLALQGSPAMWVGHHRMHHAGSDTDSDPHNARRGFFYSHMGWMLVDSVHDDTKLIRRFARDIYADPYYRWLDRYYPQILLQVLLGLILLAVGGVGLMVWGIFVRLVFVYHITWLVNSASHIWGYQTYEVDDLSRNNWIVALLSWGEGWHNNHHAYDTVAEAGHRWWEIDVTFMVIRLLKLFGLATDLKSIRELRPSTGVEQAPAPEKVVTAPAPSAG